MPTTPDEFAAAVFVLAVLSALLLVSIGRVVVWVVTQVEAWRGVKRYEAPPARYVAPRAAEEDRNAAPFTALNSPERASFVQPVQAPNGAGVGLEDITRIDAAARGLAAGLSGEASLIELFFDGVKRGGSKRYTDLRDAVRLLASVKYGWKPPEPLPVAPTRPPLQVAAGRPDGYALDRDSGARLGPSELAYEPLE